MKERILLSSLIILIAAACNPVGNMRGHNKDNNRLYGKTEIINKQFFSNSSFWNTPIAGDAETDPKSDYYIKLLETEPRKNYFGVNLDKWTIPVYEVTDTTPRYKVGLYYLSPGEKAGWKTNRESFGHGRAFAADPVPIPAFATPDKETDSHMALVDYKNRVAWDMWGLQKNADGSWQSKTGMKYSLDGDGTFVNENIHPLNGESVHFHGPGRAPGVPAIAGLIMYDEVKAGAIRHKLAFCSRFAALQEFSYPAIWTDGFLENGLPEGAVLQLDPKLDLSQFDLLPGELTVAKAMQEYGMVLVDWGGGQAIYAEGLWAQKNKSWDKVLRTSGGIGDIPYKHFRVIKMEKVIKKGDTKNAGKNPLQIN